MHSVLIPTDNHLITVDPNFKTKKKVYSNVNNNGVNGNSQDNGEDDGGIYGDLDQVFTETYDIYIWSELTENVSQEEKDNVKPGDSFDNFFTH